MPYLPRILVIAGSDSGGGAGIQADIKTITMLHGYAMTAITAVTVQNTRGVSAVHAIPTDIIHQQITSVAEDIGVDIIKTGMLHSTEVIRVAADAIERIGQPAVIDPVMVATSGDRLLEPHAVGAMKEMLCPLATLLTPNIPEAEMLSGLSIHTTEDMVRAAEVMAKLGAHNVLLKGGHLASEKVHDLLYCDGLAIWFVSDRLHTRHTHGTGCTLASAVATMLGHRLALEEAVRVAREYVYRAIETAPELGEGSGPLNHMHPIEK